MIEPNQFVVDVFELIADDGVEFVELPWTQLVRISPVTGDRYGLTRHFFSCCKNAQQPDIYFHDISFYLLFYLLISLF